MGRFRVNLFYQKGCVGAAIRALPFKIMDFEECGLPASGNRTETQLIKAAEAGNKLVVVLDDSYFGLTFENDVLKVGLAWHYIKAGSVWVLFHNGETGGYHSFLAFDPDKKIALVLLSNCAMEIFFHLTMPGSGPAM